jgi:hypothetical protein
VTIVMGIFGSTRSGKFFIAFKIIEAFQGLIYLASVMVKHMRKRP